MLDQSYIQKNHWWQLPPSKKILLMDLQIIATILLTVSLLLIFHTRYWWLFIINVSFLLIILRKSPQYLLLAVIVFIIAELVMYGTAGHLKLKHVAHQFVIHMLVNNKPVIIINHHKVLISTYQTFYVGDIIYVKGAITYISKQTIINNLYPHNISYMIEPAYINFIHQSNTLLFKLQKWLSFHPLPLILLIGVKNSASTYLWNLSLQLQVAHMFIISGLHISGFHLLLHKLFTKLVFVISKSLSIKSRFYLSQFINLFSIFIIWFYIIVINWSISTVRGGLYIVFKSINLLLGKQKWSDIQLLSLVFIVLFCFNPRLIFALSFILSFISTFAFLLTKKITRLYIKKTIWTYLIISLSVYFLTLPLHVYLQKSINCNGFFNILMLSPFIILIQTLTFISIFLGTISPVMFDFLHSCLISVLEIFIFFSLIMKLTFLNMTVLLWWYCCIFNAIIIVIQSQILLVNYYV